MKEFIEKLLEKVPLAIMVAGLLSLGFAATGGAGPFQIKDAAWRISVATVGLIICGIGIYLAIRNIPSEPPKNEYGIRITSPSNNTRVSEEFDVEGDYDTKPPEAFSLRVFVRSPMTDRTWPSSRPIQFDETRKKWKASKIRTGGKSGEERIVGIAILGQNAKALCSYSDVVGDDITDLRKKFNQHISVPGIETLTSDFVVSHKITVIHA